MTNKELLVELAACWRGDWSDFDGRTLRDQIDEWGGLSDNPTEKDVLAFRQQNGMCLLGEGHWRYYCKDNHPVPTNISKKGQHE